MSQQQGKARGKWWEFWRRKDEGAGSEEVSARKQAITATIQEQPPPERRRSSAGYVPPKRDYRAPTSLTEVRVVRIAYGFGKIQEIHPKRYLIARDIPEGVRLAPFVDGGAIQGIFVLDCEGIADLPDKTKRYPIVDSLPYFLFDDDMRKELQINLELAGIKLKTPEEKDLTAEILSELARAEVLWRHEKASGFSLKEFMGRIEDVRTSSQFKDVYLIRAKGKKRYLMAVDQLIESVIDMHPAFMNVYQPEAVRIRFDGNDNTWLAPFRASRTSSN